jgi:hypothetical protein
MEKLAVELFLCICFLRIVTIWRHVSNYCHCCWTDNLVASSLQSDSRLTGHGIPLL